MSSSKDHILSKIKAIQRDVKPLPDVPLFETEGDLANQFMHSIQLNKGEIISMEELLVLLHSGIFKKIFSVTEEFREFSNIPLPEDPHALEDLNLAIIKGQFGVAENGAIWMGEQDLGHRALPFITEHLLIVLEKKNIVSNMHGVYQKIGQDPAGFGLFIAGPSKTADIEQSLVIGAHGAISLRVVLI